MTHRIYYFSGTGNSLWAARKIQESLLDAELIPITKEMPAELTAQTSENLQMPESIGLVFPVYMFKPPRIVLEFIQKMPKSNYIYAVATCGNSPGKTLSVVKNSLLENGNTLSAGYIVSLVSNFIVLPKTKSDSYVEKAFKKAESKTQEIAMNVQKKTSHFDKEMPGVIVKPVSWLLFNPAYKRIPVLGKFFSVNDKCNHCGICRDVCPVQNIKMTAAKPVFLHECEMCFSCISWCPQKAINWTPLTKYRKRYKCKGISKNDIVADRYYKNK
ncbi:MAG: EFR1 family ferrodoxin [Methanosarcinales archaeon]|jgi:ferredoxin/flavodoxin|nr:EFR1 family ferrodoxin [Methanosarcinales archaeon]